MKRSLPVMAVAIAALLLAAPALAGKAKHQTVSCIDNGTKHSCTTPMRLVCHKAPGKTTLSRIPQAAFWMGTWHITRSDGLIASGSGPVVKHGRLSFPTPAGSKSIEVIVTFQNAQGGAGGEQVLIRTRCR